MAEVIQDRFDRGSSTVEWDTADDSTVVAWAVMGHGPAIQEWSRRSLSLYEQMRHLPGQHNQKTHGHGGGGAETGLAPEQYEALRPSRMWSPTDRDNATFELESTQQGRDVLEFGRSWQASTSGAEQFEIDTWRVLSGQSTRPVGPDRERQIRNVLDAARHVPDGMLPPTIHRGLMINKRDMAEFTATHAAGKVVDVGPAAFSTSANVAKRYATYLIDKNREVPVLVRVDTSKGVQALPIVNIARNADQAWNEEVVAMGKMRVTSVGKDPSSGIMTVNMEPVGAYG